MIFLFISGVFTGSYLGGGFNRYHLELIQFDSHFAQLGREISTSIHQLYSDTSPFFFCLILFFRRRILNQLDLDVTASF